MSELFYSLAILACPVGMGAMMWFMMRGHMGGHMGGQRNSATAMTAEQAELARMRAEIDQLRAEQRDADAPAPKQ